MVIFRKCCTGGDCEETWWPADHDFFTSLGEVVYTQGLTGNLIYNTDIGIFDYDYPEVSDDLVPVTDYEEFPIVQWGDGIRRRASTRLVYRNLSWTYQSGPWQWDPDLVNFGEFFIGENPGDVDFQAIWRTISTRPQEDPENEDQPDPDCIRQVVGGVGERHHPSHFVGLPVTLNGADVAASINIPNLDECQLNGVTHFDTSQVLTINKSGVDYKLRVYHNSTFGPGPHDLDSLDETALGAGPGTYFQKGFDQFVLGRSDEMNALGFGTASAQWDMREGDMRLDISAGIRLQWENGRPEAWLRGVYQRMSIRLTPYIYIADQENMTWVSANLVQRSGPSGLSRIYTLRSRPNASATTTSITPPDYFVSFGVEEAFPYRYKHISMQDVCTAMGLTFDSDKAYLMAFCYATKPQIGVDPYYIIDEDPLLISHDFTNQFYPDRPNQGSGYIFFNSNTLVVGTVDVTYYPVQSSDAYRPDDKALIGWEPLAGAHIPDPYDEWYGEELDSAIYRDEEDIVDQQLVHQFTKSWSGDISGQLFYHRLRDPIFEE